MDLPCNDPSCMRCGKKPQVTNQKTSHIINQDCPCKNLEGLDANSSATGTCLTCAGTGPNDPRIACGAAFFQHIGVGITGVTGTVFTIIAPNGITLDSARVSGAIDQVNSQLPTGSFRGYINSIYNNIGTSLVTNVRDGFIIIMVGILLSILLLYAIVCLVFIALGSLTVAAGVALIFTGMIIILIVLLIIISEVRKFGTNIENTFGNQLGDFLDNISCALTSGTCCYTGGNCCCPNGSQSLCKNSPFPPLQDSELRHILEELMA